MLVFIHAFLYYMSKEERIMFLLAELAYKEPQSVFPYVSFMTVTKSCEHNSSQTAGGLS